MLSENFILVENTKRETVETILSNLTKLYSDTGFTEGIQLSKHNGSDEKFLITFKNTPDFDRFAYFTNYIHYPENINTGGLIVNGFYQMKSTDSKQDLKAGDWLQMYISESDTSYDNVSIINSANESFLFDFGGRVKKLPSAEKNYHLPVIDKGEYSLLKATSTIISPEPESSKPWWKFWQVKLKILHKHGG